jgi:2,3-bisphosphoglycerate-independent phosphoglycerate mutase
MKNNKINKTILVITDGIGHNPDKSFNAFANAKTPTYDYMFQNLPNSLIKTYGLSVGLPEGQMGNSEIGHMTIGSGRVLYSNLVKISKAIESKKLLNNKKIQDFYKNANAIHLVGLVSDGGVHSHIDHLFGLINIFTELNKNSYTEKKIFIHVITDGRDVSPTSSKKYISSILEKYKDEKNIEIATLGGRFYTMDRDKRWERIQKGYDAISSATPKTELNPIDYISQSYDNNETDEFIVPVAFENYTGIQESDSFLFYNFRTDRMREIVTALSDTDFKNIAFDNSEILQKNINILTMTEYSDQFNFDILFENETPKNTLAEVIAKSNLSQFHTAETEKYAHVTFFMNGGIETPFENETRVLVKSPNVKTYDLKPEMSANEVTENVIKALDFGYDFIVVNYANGDMVGHTGSYESAIKAVETVDSNLKLVLDKAREKNYSFVLTSDHGNCEAMQDKNGNILTNHTVGDVFCFVESSNYKIEKIQNGGLNNIAPTVLKLMNLDIPKEMDQALF